MKLDKIFRVYWNYIDSSTFMYGTKLTFNNKKVIFKNQLTPSGIVIHEWKMLTKYAQDKTTPQLPILKRGFRYVFSFDYTTIPHHSIYFKIIFCKRNGKEFKTEIVKIKEVEIEYPKEAYSYKIQMINAASKQISFNMIRIREVDISSVVKEDMEIGTMINKREHNNFINIIFEEDCPIAKFELSSNSISHIHNAIVVKNWNNGNLSLNLQEFIEYFKKTYINQKANFIGCGTYSNEIARILSKLGFGRALITNHENCRLRQQLINQLFILDEPIFEENFYIYYDYNCEDNHINILKYMINNGRYLRYLDQQLLNCGGKYEL